MVLNKEDYQIDGDKITISRYALESWRDHYSDVAASMSVTQKWWRYAGKRDVLNDIIKLFEDSE